MSDYTIPPAQAQRIVRTAEILQTDGKQRFLNDKVALFLQRAGYDAIVPGKEDFYFGAYHLMKLARLLRKDGHSVMFADNLFLQQTTPKRYSREVEPTNSAELDYVVKRDGISAGFSGEATRFRL